MEPGPHRRRAVIAADDATAERVRRAADRTISVGTARIRQTMRAGDQLAVVGLGTVDFARRRALAVLALPPGPEMPDAPAAVEVTMIIDGGDVYTEVLERPGRWIVDQLPEGDTALSDGDPGMLLDWLRGVTRASTAGRTQLEGVEVTAIDVVVDVDQAVERAPRASRRALRAVIETTFPDGAPCDLRVWLDDEDRVRRLAVDLDVTTHDRPDRLDVELFDFGTPAAIELPDEDALLTAAEWNELSTELTERDDTEPGSPSSDWHAPTN